MSPVPLSVCQKHSLHRGTLIYEPIFLIESLALNTKLKSCCACQAADHHLTFDQSGECSTVNFG